MKVVVTGAAGQLGTAVCRELVRAGHEVVGTDRRETAELDLALIVADLRDPQAAYRLLEGASAVVHLGNIPSLGAGPMPQVVLANNVAMNANVFRAAVDFGIRRVVFASSLQAMIRLDEGRAPDAPLTIPYFPLDGDAPANPGNNFYGLSKEFGERMLRLFCERDPELAATALRFPMLASEAFCARLAQPQPVSALNWFEGLTYLSFADAARLIKHVVERQRSGYHQYFPAQTFSIAGFSPAAIVAKFFAGIPLRVPAAKLESLVDWSALENDLGFRPASPLAVELM